MRESRTYKIVMYIVLTVLCLIIAFPFLNMLMMAFMTPQEIQSVPLPFFPKSLQIENFKGIMKAFGYYGPNLEHAYIWRFLLNTLFLITVKTIGIILSATLCAFGFSKIKFPGRNVAFMIMMATIMIPGAVLQIPSFILFRDFGWLDTLNPLWIPGCFGGGAMTIFLLRQFMRGLPDTMMEAARIDGASYFNIYARIILPNCKPMMFYILINQVNSTWGDYFSPYLYVNSKEKWTVALAMVSMAQSVGNAGDVLSIGSLGVQMATCALMSIVPLVTFLLGRKNFIENVTLTGVKG